MNSIMTQFEMMCDAIVDGDYLEHYGRSKTDGAPIGSGRYRLGSGENPYQHELDFYNMVQKQHRDGMSYTEIAKANGMTSTEFRKKLSNCSAIYKQDRDNHVIELSKKGYSFRKIEEETGVPESTVRKILNPETRARTTKNQETADKLREYLKEYDMVDIGPGTELALGVSRDRIKNAAALLEESGDYKVQQVWVDQMTGKGKTNITTLVPADWDYNKDVLPNVDKIHPITDTVIDTDGNILVGKALNPTSVDSKRICVNYAEKGGLDNDGIIEVRPGCPDLDLGNSHYAQVRIAVDGTHYLKGVARPNPDVPEGYDIMVQSNKPEGTPLCGSKDRTVAKPMKNDPANPFGSSIKEEDKLRMVQKYYFDENGKRKLSALNIVNEEGDWDRWARTVAAQTLSKEDPKLAKYQLDLTLAQHKAEFDSICSLTNPTVKRKLLEDFSESSDAAARDLKATAFPGQRTKLLLPINNQKDNECYCEDWPNGTVLYAIRYPHGGTFETAELVVNNNNKFAKKVMGGAVDGIGVTPATRARLSGADCDGDTVTVIPRSSRVVLKTSKLPDTMKDFDPHAYKLPEGKEPMKEKTKQIEMGKVSNLITDMTIKIDENVRKRGYITAEEENDIARAVKASMVVIDAPKHKLDYAAACREFGINQLKKKYQYDPETGSTKVATLISRAGSEIDVPERRSRTGIYSTNTDPETGKKIWKETERTYPKKTVDEKTGRVTVKEGVKATQKSARMDETDDARTLSSGTLMERIYADYANGEKDLANRARKEYMRTPRQKIDPAAKVKYAAEVKSLTDQLIIAKKNAPLERKANSLASSVYRKAIEDNPDMSKDDKKKLRGRLIINARNAVGAGKTKINISDKEWEAIQAGAVSDSVLNDILRNADSKQVRQLATPRTAKRGLTASQVNLVERMVKNGYTKDEIADRMAVSVGTINYVLSDVYSNKS